MKMSRAFGGPSKHTFTIKPIAALLDRYCPPSDLVNGPSQLVIVDPFAGFNSRGTITNDLNPSAPSTYHLEAGEFADMIQHPGGAYIDVVLFDPPYSPRQISEAYKGFGKDCGQQETQNGRLYKRVADKLDPMIKLGGIVIRCGWNSGGFNKTRGYEMIEVLLVNHGAAHNDTIVTVERKVSSQSALSEPTQAAEHSRGSET